MIARIYTVPPTGTGVGKASNSVTASLLAAPSEIKENTLIFLKIDQIKTYRYVQQFAASVEDRRQKNTSVRQYEYILHYIDPPPGVSNLSVLRKGEGVIYVVFFFFCVCAGDGGVGKNKQGRQVE
jgi:hypothetical protein